MNYMYGNFSQKQISETKQKIQKKIFFLLLLVDPKTKENYPNVDINQAYDSLLHRLGGLNTVLGEPQELVTIISLLQEAVNIYNAKDFNFATYRKLILDAGSEIMKLKEVSEDANI